MTVYEEYNVVENDLIQISENIYHNPELGNNEFKAQKILMDYLQKHHFKVTSGICDISTSFKAEFDSEKPGPTISYLAEYDALPEIGHGCGHNLIAATSTGAGIVLSKLVNQLGGKVVVFGTPAEETNGAKVTMAEQGVFDEIDVAMMAHPFGFSEESGKTLALDAIQFAFTGKSSHAAGSPEKGVNALDGVIQLFNGVNALREHVSSDVRMHGIISKGGEAANVVPDYAVAQFYFRAESRINLDTVVHKVKNIADGAAAMTGASVEISNYEFSNDNLVTNQKLSEIFTKNLKSITEEKIAVSESASGSSDIGNVSQKIPVIHPHVGMNDKSIVPHTKKFAETTMTENGRDFIKKGVIALSQTGYDLLQDSSLLTKIQQEFNENKL